MIMLMLSLGIFVLFYNSTFVLAGVNSWKSTGDLGTCTHIFRPSKREKSRSDQHDPLLLWLGRPSQALQVEGKHGERIHLMFCE